MIQVDMPSFSFRLNSSTSPDSHVSSSLSSTTTNSLSAQRGEIRNAFASNFSSTEISAPAHDLLSLSRDGEVEITIEDESYRKHTVIRNALDNSPAPQRVIPCLTPLSRPKSDRERNLDINSLTTSEENAFLDCLPVEKTLKVGLNIMKQSEDTSSIVVDTTSTSSTVDKMILTINSTDKSLSEFENELTDDQRAALLLMKEAAGSSSQDFVNTVKPVPILFQNSTLAELRQRVLHPDVFDDANHSVNRKESSTVVTQSSKSQSLEASLFTQEVAILPDMHATAYENVPIEEYGMAMLLGMGFDPKKHNTKPLELKKRVYQRAGLGADKALERDLEELEQMSRMATSPSTEFKTSSYTSLLTKKDNNMTRTHSSAYSRADSETDHRSKETSQVISSTEKRKVKDFRHSTTFQHSRSNSFSLSSLLIGEETPSSQSKLSSAFSKVKQPLSSKEPRLSSMASSAAEPFCWVQKGLYVKIASSSCPYFRRKGIVLRAKRRLKSKGYVCTIDLALAPSKRGYQSTPWIIPGDAKGSERDLVDVDAEDLETVISAQTMYAKVVSPSLSSSSSTRPWSCTLGESVKVEMVDFPTATVLLCLWDPHTESYRGPTVSATMDDVCEYISL